jgi:hypothetical protein
VMIVPFLPVTSMGRAPYFKPSSTKTFFVGGVIA